MVQHPRSRTDPRALRTVGRLGEALESLAAAGGAFSVDELTRRAGLNRSSFYAHFTDFDDLVSWWLGEQLRPVIAHDLELRHVAARPERDVGRQSIALLVRTMGAHRTTLAALFTQSLSARRTFTDRFTEAIRPNFEAIGPHLGWSAGEVETASVFYGTGLAAVLIAWTAGDLELTEAELVERCVDLVPEHLRTSDA